MKSGNLNFLEASEPLQACNGTALPFFLPVPLLSLRAFVACERVKPNYIDIGPN
jgi:hypothetical protein